MTRRRAFFLTTLLTTALTSAMAAPALSDVKVVTSIKPVHSLVSAVMKGVGEPALLVKGAASPHDYALKPSDAKNLQEANVIFWIGHELEAFLEKPIETVGSNATAISLLDAPGLATLDFRESDEFGEHGHGHDDHGHSEAKAGHDDHSHEGHGHSEAKAGHDDHGHDDHGHSEAKAGHDDHGHGDHGHSEAKADHAGHGHEGHDHGGVDPHVWLDPENAITLVAAIENALKKADPANAETYHKNADALAVDLSVLTEEVKATLEPVHEKGFIVFHDAYQYFERRFDMSASGAITVNPETPPGAERVRDLQKTIRKAGVSCVFAEPQFQPKVISTVIEGTNIKTGTLDPLGAGLTDGPDLYPDLIRGMAASFRTCLSAGS